MNILLNMLLSLVSAIVGVALTLWYSNLGEPRLRFLLKPSKAVEFSNGRKSIFVNLYVKNEPRRRFPYVKRETAYACHGDITFSDKDGNSIGSPMAIRWSGNPEPIKYEVVNNQIVPLPEPSLIRSSRFIDIPPDAKEELDVAFRSVDEVNAYGWNSESYFPKKKICIV